MNEDLQLGYLILGAADYARINMIFTQVLGLLPAPIGDGRVAYRMDDWDRRFVVEPGADGLHALGLVARDPRAYLDFRSRLEAAGVQIRPGSPDECRLRGVRELVAFTDPAGNPVELAAGPVKARTTSYASPLVPGGFLTGSQGLGHVVLITDDRDTMVSFFQRALGFELTDTSEEATPDGPSKATFMHCNRRHHTIAVVERPPVATARRSLGHFMIQANEFDAVGMAYDRAVDAGMPIFRSLGRHPNDRMFSFYARTDAGFDIEFGAGAVEVGEDWQVLHYQQISAWGHRPGPGM
jgi:2,3-dihydroxybiphenyl 1,2-dioxygenase